MNRLFTAFDPVSKNKWLEQINIDLKGNTEKLISTTEGITIKPIYHADDNFKTYNSNFPSTWETYQLIDAANVKEANKRALNALHNDVSGLCFSNPNNLDILFKNISIEHIRIDFLNYSEDFPMEWADFAKNKNVKGAFHGITNSNIPNYLNTILTEGTAKEQITNALQKGQEASTKVMNKSALEIKHRQIAKSLLAIIFHNACILDILSSCP